MTESLLDNTRVIQYFAPVSRVELLNSLAQSAIDAGWARSGFTQALLAREEKYPTGLHTQGVEVAIPHADPEWTLKPAMFIAILNRPTEFEPMGGQGGPVAAKFVFLLLIPDADTHLQFLQSLAEFIESEALLTNLGATEDVGPLIAHLRKGLYPVQE